LVGQQLSRSKTPETGKRFKKNLRVILHIAPTLAGVENAQINSLS
jgi:hypothetical protein